MAACSLPRTAMPSFDFSATSENSLENASLQRSTEPLNKRLAERGDVHELRDRVFRRFTEIQIQLSAQQPVWHVAKAVKRILHRVAEQLSTESIVVERDTEIEHP